MKIAIHQPEHFPYMGFFQKMQLADLFVILDDVQYTKGGWQNRNKFLNTNGVEEFFTIQVEPRANKKLIKDVQAVDGSWRKKIVKKIQQNFKVNMSNIYNKKKLIDINLDSIMWGRKKLNIKTKMIMSSELGINTTQTQRILDICKAVNACEYICGQGAVDSNYGAYLDTSMFTDIKLSIHKPILKNYYSVIYNVQ